MESPVDRAWHCMDLGSVVGFVSPVDRAWHGMDLGSAVGFVIPVDRAWHCMGLGSAVGVVSMGRTLAYFAGRTRVSREQASPRTPPHAPMGGKIHYIASDMESPVDRV